MSDTIDTILTKMGQDSARIAENVPKVYEAGKQAEKDRFWDAYQNFGKKGKYEYSFFCWENDAFAPKYPFVISDHYGLNCTFRASNIKRIEQPIICTVDVALLYTFFDALVLECIEHLEVTEECTYTIPFSSCKKLEILNVFGTIGQNGFDVQWCPLSHDSLMSIINALADKSEDTSGTTWTVTLGRTNIAKLTDEEINIATQKGWVLG